MISSEKPGFRYRTQPLIIGGLFLLATLAAIHQMSELPVPVTFAFLIYLLLLPVVRWLGVRRVPEAVSAAFVVLAVILVGVSIANTLASPAESWLSDAPKSLRELQQQLTAAEGRFTAIQELADETTAESMVTLQILSLLMTQLLCQLWTRRPVCIRQSNGTRSCKNCRRVQKSENSADP